MELTLTGTTLPAHEAPWATTLRSPDGPLRAMADAAGGPFHVLHPATFRDNVRAFDDVLRAAGVPGRVMYGRKANRSDCFLRACAATGAGADVASVAEFDAALAAGLLGPDLVVTGPAKSTELLDLVLRHDALVAVDALDELDRLLDRARAPARRARVLLRVLPRDDPASRFGCDDAECDEAVARCAAAPDVVEMEGFSFHLSGYRPEPRARQAAELVDRCRRARRHGVRAATISIGGGFAVSYVPEDDWRRFTEGHDRSWYHAGRRPDRFYPYHQHPTGAAMLADILDAPAGDGGTLAGALCAAGIRLLLEPGRALLDRCGASVFGVQGYKTRDDGHGRYGIVTVDGLSTSLSEQWKGSEFLPDPALWTDGPDPAPREPVVACVGGASCLEYDMLTWRKIAFGRAPRFGDLLVYPNTAGYQMDKNETRFHGLPLPARIVLDASTWRVEPE